MAKNVEILSASSLAADIGEQNIVGEHFSLILDTRSMPGLLKLSQPYRASESRLARVVGGTAVYRINLVDYTLREHDMFFVPPDSIIEIEEISTDYAAEVLVIGNLQGVGINDSAQILPHDVICLHLTEDYWQRVTEYFGLIASELRREMPVYPAVSHLVLALQCEINSLWHRMEKGQTLSRRLRGEEVFGRFLKLLREHGMTHRNISFYAQRLALTPNHLSAVVRQQSSQSVMDWLNRTTIMEAKVLLKHSTLMMYEIADRLCFPEPTAFSRYFKKHTGMTPLQYREK